MHSSSIFTIFSASALFALTQAAPVAHGPASRLAERGIYSKCKLPSGLNWDGECSVDPCGMWISWCPDYEYGTKNPINKGSSPAPAPVPQPPIVADETPDMTKGAYYRCAASGFDGTCSYDPCDGQRDSWCNDYEWKSYTPKKSAPSPAPEQPPSDGGFAPLTTYAKCTTSSGLEWDGFCTVKICELGLSWCPDFIEGTFNPKAANVKPVDEKDWIRPADGKPVYSECKLAASNLQWKGTCSVDPCINNLGWCPDLPYAQYPSSSPSTPEKATSEGVVLPAPATCAAVETRFEPNAGNTCKYGLGINFYTCQNNGFKGCCSSDPCAKAWCPDYKQGCYSA